MVESHAGAGVATDAPTHSFNALFESTETYVRFFFLLAVPTTLLAESCATDGPDD